MRLIERRIGLLFAVFLLAFSIVLARAVWLQGVKGSSFASQANLQQSETIEVPALRGTVLDRRGREMAVSEDAVSIYATPYQVKDPPHAAELLAPVLEMDPDDVLEALTVDSGFSYLARKVDLPTARRVERLHLAGIGELPDSLRTYPQGELAAQVIGAVGTDNEGLTGLEAGEEDILGGTDGERIVVKDALGDPLRLETLSATEDGQDIQLTIDSAIQDVAEEVLARVGADYSPVGATAIVMDPRDSRILAMANWPPLDPSNLEEADEEDFLNRATGFTYEPGSTFKAFTVAAALQENLVEPQSTFTLAPSDPGRRPRDRGVAPARHRDADGGGHPRSVIERRRGDDRRWRSAPTTTPTGSTASASANPPACAIPPRSRGSSRRSRSTRARRWATCRSARASR